jgi:hypothetical protein
MDCMIQPTTIPPAVGAEGNDVASRSAHPQGPHDGRRKAKEQRGELGKSGADGISTPRSGEVVLDPDEQAQATIRLVFDLFGRLRTIGKVLEEVQHAEIKLTSSRVRMGGYGDQVYRT